MRAAQGVVQLLREQGVTHIFGLVGSSAMEIYDALYEQSEIAYIGAKDERAAAGMADGFARATGRIGVVLAGQSGPGVTNLVSGLAGAKAARSPVLSLGGAVSTDHWQKDAFQEIDQESLLRPVTKAVLTALRGSRVVDTVERAIQIAMTHPMGPVHVNLPRDVLMEDAPEPVARGPLGQASLPLDLAGLERVGELLRTARRPVVVAGGEVKWHRAGPDVIRLAEALGAPIVTSAGHRDAVANDAPRFLGQMGARGSELANWALRHSDLVLGVGTRFAFNSTFFERESLGSDNVIVQVSTDPLALGRYVPDAVTVQASPADACRTLVDVVRRLGRAGTDPTWLADLDARVTAVQAERAEAPEPTSVLDPHAFFHTLRAKLPPDSIVTLDAGTWCLKASEQLDFFTTPGLFTPLDFASLGFGFPAAIGAQLAVPDRRCFAVIGDGGALFALSELATLREYGIPVVLVVMDNQAWGAEKAYQKDFYASRFIGTDLPGQDMVAIANGFGVRAARAQNPKELATALDEAIAERSPMVIDAEVDRDVLFSFRKDIFSRKG